MIAPETAFLRFQCSRCGAAAPGPAPYTVSPCCGGPLVSIYDAELAGRLLPAPGAAGPRGLWRYRGILPLPAGHPPVTLGEGGTPLLPLERLGREIGVPRLQLKVEAANPTGSFKDRGLAVAVSIAAAAGVRGFVLPTAGNAGASTAAFAARAGRPASIHAPRATPREILAEIRFRGARLTLHDGSIADAGAAAREEAARTGALDLATFKEPGRVEGKKTMGYEIREDLGRLPEAIVYPCGGGTGIVAMARAFDEMEALGWCGPERPRLYAVQVESCAPIARAFAAGKTEAAPVDPGPTRAAGLRVPSPFAHVEILAALRRTGGAALAVPEDEIVAAGRRLARCEGILPCPEGAAALAGLRRLRDTGGIEERETVVLFETASGLKYLDAWAEAGEA